MTDFVDGIGFKEAMDYAATRKVILPEEYYGKLIGVQRSQSVSVAGLAALEQVKFVIDQLAKVMKDGGTLKSFQESVKAGGMKIDLPQHRLDNIFRTNIQAAYSRGRWEQQMRVRGTRPYLMYDAINDSRTRPAHHAMDNIIRKWDDPFWKTNYPTNGYRCRCTVISLSESQAKKRGITEEMPDPETTKPDDGWNYNPGEGYETGPNVGLARTAEKIKVKTPRVSKKVDDTVKKVKAEAKKVGPATLDEIMALGEAELAKLPTNPKEFDKAFEELLMTRVVKAKRGSKDANREAIRKHAQEAMGASQVTVTGAASGLTAFDYIKGVQRTLALPSSWIKATAKRYKNLTLSQSKSRAYADQAKGLLSIDIDHPDVILHEYLHLVQIAMPDVETLCREMHRKRTANSPLNSMRTLTGNAAYDAAEMTREDKYFNPYVGKEYDTRITGAGGFYEKQEPLEVLTMVIQALIGSVGSMANKAGGYAMRNALLSKDRESAAFGLGLLLHYA